MICGCVILSRVRVRVSVSSWSPRGEAAEGGAQGQVDGRGSIQTDLVVPMTVKAWFLEPQFYQVAGVYMSTRLFVNLSQAYMPLYLIESLKLQTTYTAILPLVMCVAGFVMSFLMKPLNRLAGRKITYLLGSAVGIGASVFVYYGCDCSGQGP